MSPEEVVEAAGHEHLFYRRKGWWWHRKSWFRWECDCGYRTRAYDSIDAAMTRPIHPHMSVAVHGFNTAKRAAK